MEKKIYLDNAATTKTRPEVVEAMLPTLVSYMVIHPVYMSFGTQQKALDESRATIASALGCDGSEIYFTSGGTEADNWALIATAEAYEQKGKHIITSKIEHHAVLHTCEYLEKRGFEVTYIDVDENGIVKLDQLEKAIRPNNLNLHHVCQ